MVYGGKKVDKRPLIGIGILAVVLLLLSSWGNVVGYQSVKSTVNDSPLFRTRTQRATNQPQNILPSHYLGMEKEHLIQFPFRDNRSEQLVKAIQFISKMDDKTFTRFTERCIQRIRQDKSIINANPAEIVTALLLIKTRPKIILYYLLNRENQKITSGIVVSVCSQWFPGCILIDFLFLIWITFLFIWDTVWSGETVCAQTCAAECLKINKMKEFISL